MKRLRAGLLRFIASFAKSRRDRELAFEPTTRLKAALRNDWLDI